MSQDVYNFSFDESVSAIDAQSTFMLALIAVESMHGSVAVRLECRFHFNAKKRLYHVHAGSPIGNDLARIFAGFAFHSYGCRAVRVRRGDADVRPHAGRLGGAVPPRREFVQ